MSAPKPSGSDERERCEDCGRELFRDGVSKEGHCGAHLDAAESYGWDVECMSFAIARLRQELAVRDDLLRLFRDSVRFVRTRGERELLAAKAEAVLNIDDAARGKETGT